MYSNCKINGKTIWIKAFIERLNMSKKLVERYYYPAIFNYEDEKGISITFPDLPNCVTEGKDEIDALKSARECLGIVLLGMEEDNEKIPVPTALKNIKTKKNEKAILIDVYMPTVRLASVNRSVNRTVTLPAWLNAMALERNINFSHILQEALKNEFHLLQN